MPDDVVGLGRCVGAGPWNVPNGADRGVGGGKFIGVGGGAVGGRGVGGGLREDDLRRLVRAVVLAQEPPVRHRAERREDGGVALEPRDS